jgi:Flp pilus assembly protein TadG
MGGKSPRRGWDEGAVAAETAITFSVLFVLVYGVMQLGIALWQLNATELAVLQAGRWAMVNNTDSTIIADAETQMTNALPGGTATISSSWPPNSPAAGNWYVNATTSGSSPTLLNLNAMYAFNLLLPANLVLGTDGPYTVASQATVPLEPVQ